MYSVCHEKNRFFFARGAHTATDLSARIEDKEEDIKTNISGKARTEEDKAALTRDRI